MKKIDIDTNFLAGDIEKQHEIYQEQQHTAIPIEFQENNQNENYPFIKPMDTSATYN